MVKIYETYEKMKLANNEVLLAEFLVSPIYHPVKFTHKDKPETLLLEKKNPLNRSQKNFKSKNKSKLLILTRNRTTIN